MGKNKLDTPWEAKQADDRGWYIKTESDRLCWDCYDESLGALDEAQARLMAAAPQLEASLMEVLDMCREGWQYASEYYRDKWEDQEVYRRAEEALKKAGR